MDPSFPVLFSIDKSGKRRHWSVTVTGDTVTSVSGLETGKKITTNRQYSGKNVGKKNETSPEQQAELEAYKDWVKKVEKGYLPDDTDHPLYVALNTERQATGGKNLNAVAKMKGVKGKTVTDTDSYLVPGYIGPKPMKTTELKTETIRGDKRIKASVLKHFNFKNRVYTQPKIDGYRCIVNAIDEDYNSIVMTSNSGKQFSWFASLREEIALLFKNLLQSDNDRDSHYLSYYIFDGLDCELYSPVFYNTDTLDNRDHPVPYSATQRFSIIQSICSVTAKQPHALEDQICIYVFDLVDLSGKVDQNTRLDILKKISMINTSTRIVFVPTEEIVSEQALFENHDRYVEEGYEGVILRSGDLRYKEGPSRASMIQKYKSFVDSEYEIVGVDRDTGVAIEQFVWVCTLPDGSEFKVKPMGTKEEKLYMFENFKDYIGKMLTVKYQELSADGIPRFPVAKGVRDDM